MIVPLEEGKNDDDCVMSFTLFFSPKDDRASQPSLSSDDESEGPSDDIEYWADFIRNTRTKIHTAEQLNIIAEGFKNGMGARRICNQYKDCGLKENSVKDILMRCKKRQIESCGTYFKPKKHLLQQRRTTTDSAVDNNINNNINNKIIIDDKKKTKRGRPPKLGNGLSYYLKNKIKNEQALAAYYIPSSETRRGRPPKLNNGLSYYLQNKYKNVKQPLATDTIYIQSKIKKKGRPLKYHALDGTPLYLKNSIKKGRPLKYRALDGTPLYLKNSIKKRSATEQTNKTITKTEQNTTVVRIEQTNNASDKTEQSNTPLDKIEQTNNASDKIEQSNIPLDKTQQNTAVKIEQDTVVKIEQNTVVVKTEPVDGSKIEQVEETGGVEVQSEQIDILVPNNVNESKDIKTVKRKGRPLKYQAPDGQPLYLKSKQYIQELTGQPYFRKAIAVSKKKNKKKVVIITKKRAKGRPLKHKNPDGTPRYLVRNEKIGRPLKHVDEDGTPTYLRSILGYPPKKKGRPLKHLDPDGKPLYITQKKFGFTRTGKPIKKYKNILVKKENK